MRIRELTRDDLPQVISIVHETFSKDELMRWLYPRMDDYPDDTLRFQGIRLRTRIVDVGSHGWVAVSEEGDEMWKGEEEVLGFAFYVREGGDEAAGKWRKDSVFKKIERKLLSWELWYDGTFLDRSLDKQRLQLWIDNEPDALFEKLGGYWHLGLLATAPKYQRRGIGRKLVEFGQEMGRKERVPVTLEASVVGRGLYLRSGFRIVNWMDLAVQEGIAAVHMVWEPEEEKGRWLVDKGDGKAEVKAVTEG